MMVQIDTDKVEVVAVRRAFGELEPPDKHGAWMLTSVAEANDGRGVVCMFARHRAIFAVFICAAMRGLCGAETDSERAVRIERERKQQQADAMKGAN